MAGSVVALGEEDVVLLAAVERLVQRDRGAHELLLDLAEAVEARLDLQVVVGVGLGDGADDGDVVALGADVVRPRYHGDVDVVLAADLRLRDDQLHRVAVVRLVDRVVEDADGFDQVSDHLGLVREVGGVRDDLAALGLELHAVALLLAVFHGGTDAGNLAVLVFDFVDVGVEHVRAAVDGGQTGEALRQLAQTVQGVDVRRLSVTGHGVDVQADALDAVLGHALGFDVVVGGVEGHAVADEVAGGRLQAVLVVDLLHGGLGKVHSCIIPSASTVSHPSPMYSRSYRCVCWGCSRRSCQPTAGSSSHVSSQTCPSRET